MENKNTSTWVQRKNNYEKANLEKRRENGRRGVRSLNRSRREGKLTRLLSASRERKTKRNMTSLAVRSVCDGHDHKLGRMA